MPEPVAQPRLIPGAPPKEPLTKSQKRRRKAKQAGHDDGVAEATPAPPAHKALEPEESSLAVEQAAQPDATSSLPEEEALLSPIVELVNKRLKVTTKKIGRNTVYAATDLEKLNDDQKRTLKSLPILEAVQKELSEVKKAIESYEADLGHELAAKRVDAEKAENARVRDAIESTKTDLISRTSDLLSLLRMRPAFATGAFDGSAFFADDLEREAVYSITSALNGEDLDRKASALNGLFFGTGDFEGVSFSRIAEIVQSLLNPPHASTPTQDSPVDDRQLSVSAASISGEDAPAAGGPEASSSFHFMQESELEAEPTFEESAEWIEKPHESRAAAEVATNGHAHVAAPAVPAGTGGAILDWSADHEGESDLPPLESLGPSGSVTPAEGVPMPARTNGMPVAEGDDGFTAPHRGGRGGRGRHHHRGEHRGGEHREHHRGGYRSNNFRGERGAFRGGEHGERGGYRGVDRGFRGSGGDEGARGGEEGGFRGGEQGGYRGGDRGERGEQGGYRGFRGNGGFRGRGGGGGGSGDWRNDGGERGRGRGRGRPDRGGGPPQAQQPATPSQV